MKNLLKKLLLSFLIFLLLATSNLSLFAPVARAQTWYNQNPMEWYIKVYDEGSSPSNEIFGERYTAAQVQWVLWSLFATGFNLPFTMLGMPPTPSVCAAKLALGLADPLDCSKAIQEFITAVTVKIVSLFTLNNTGVEDALAQISPPKSVWEKIFLEDRPISGIAYVRNLGRKLKLVPEAKAADSFGFSRLLVIQDLWKFSRNVAYFFFILAIIITAFMIMFKVKISPQAVVTVQSTLPKIIVALILVTFSYAIAGFLIDLMYVIMGIFSLVLSTSSIIGAQNNSVLANFNIVDGFGTGGLAILVYWFVFLCMYAVATILVFFSALSGAGVTGVVWGLILGIFTILLFFILIIDLFRITFALFKALAGFYLTVILGPFLLTVGALPQSRNALGSWLKSLIAKLAVFPTTGILFYVAFIFIMKSIEISIIGIVDGHLITDLLKEIPLVNNFLSDVLPFRVDSLWGPPMLHNAESATAIAFILMALGCIMIIPKVSKAIESAFKGREFDMESAVEQPIKQVVGAAGTGVEAFGKAKESGSIASIGAIIQSLSR